MEEDKEKEKSEPDFKDYVAIVIALLETTMVPFVVVIAVLLIMAFLFLFFLSHT